MDFNLPPELSELLRQIGVAFDTLLFRGGAREDREVDVGLVDQQLELGAAEDQAAGVVRDARVSVLARSS